MNRDAIRALPGYARLSDGGRYLIERTMDAPSRLVGANSLLSVSGETPDPALGANVQYESHGCEKYFIWLAQLDPAVHCVIDQPPKLSVFATDSRGRQGPRLITPDFVRCGYERFDLIEAKPREGLLKKQAKSPTDWLEGAGNQWRYLPGEAAAETLGMGFRVFCPDAYPKAQLANLAIRHRLAPMDVAREHRDVLDQLQRHVGRRPCTVRELCGQLSGATGGLIYLAIEQGHLYGLLDRQLFDADFLVYGSEAQAREHRDAIDRMAPTMATVGHYSSLLARASATAMARAKEDLEQYDADRAAGVAKSSTAFRQAAREKEALAEGAPRIAAFVPDFMGRGSREPKIEKDLRGTLQGTIRELWKEAKSPLLSKLRAEFEAAAAPGTYVPPKETFRVLFNEAMTPEKAAFLAGGKRAFHAKRPMTDGRKAVPRLKIGGLHVHLDGVYGDRYSREFEEQLFLRPIVYPMVDDSSGYVMGRGIKIGKASRMPVGMAYRDTYQRHSWLPSQVIRDCGSEFESHFQSELSAQFGCTNERRPIGAPRFGGRGESFNRQLSAYLQTKSGGSYFDKAGRAADGDRKGRRHADEDIAALIRDIDTWIFNVWNKTPIGGEEFSPEELFFASLKVFPEAVIPTKDSPRARYVTSMPLGITAFTYTRGARFGGVRFGSGDLASMLARGEKPTDPRLDVMDPSVIWVMTDAGPVSLHSLETTRIGGLDVGARMAEIERLFGYNATASRNQHARNLREARQTRLQREAKTVTDALREPANEPVAAPPNAAPAIDEFSALADLTLPIFKRHRSNTHE